MRVISAIMNFYWSHSIALQKLSNERSYKFSWILTLTEVIRIRNLRFFALASNNGVHNLIKREVSREKLKSPVKNYSRRATFFPVHHRKHLWWLEASQFDGWKHLFPDILVFDSWKYLWRLEASFSVMHTNKSKKWQFDFYGPGAIIISNLFHVDKNIHKNVHIQIP